MKTITKIRRYV